MKRLGLIGSVDSAMPDLYCQAINSEVRGAFGPGHSVAAVIDCIDIADTEPWVARQDWAGLTGRLATSARIVAGAGAEALLLCHSAWLPAARQAAELAELPLVDMAAAMAAKIASYRLERVALIGLRTDAEEKIWRERLDGLDVVTPDPKWRDTLHHRLTTPWNALNEPPPWKAPLMAAITSWRKNEDVQGLVMTRHVLARAFSMTETMMPVFDTAVVHGNIAAKWAIASDRRPAPPCVYAA